MDYYLSQVFDVLTTARGLDPALRNLICLTTSIILYGIYINLDRSRSRSRAGRPLRCPDSILRG
jgi:hypothetical protein